MAKILVTGASGQLGSELQACSHHWPGLAFIFTDSTELDISRAEVVEQFFRTHSFDYCINCAAYTAVDKAESEEERAFRVNEQGARNLASSAAAQQIKLFHLSTDYVYHNALNRPLREEDPCQPQSVYARSKYAGEQAVLKLLPSAMVLRTSWVYSAFGHNFVKTMLRLGKEREQLNIVYDQIGTPTYARDLALAILRIIRQLESGAVEQQAAAGIFNFSNEGVTSWYDFALAIWQQAGIECSAAPILSRAYPTPAPRPAFSLLDKEKIKQTFGLSIPHWRQSLPNCLFAIKQAEQLASSS